MAIIPCLDEEANVARVVAAVRRFIPTVLVVDDGSSDGTAAQAVAAGAEILRHNARKGKGAALQTGWREANQRGFKWALTLDGDGQHDAGDIPALFDRAAATGARLVVGNRMAAPRGMPWLRRIVNAWMSRQLSKATGRPLPDSQSGFRLMDLSAWAALPAAVAHFEIESEILVGFAAAGHRIEFVPIRVIYRNEKSKINPLRDTIRWFRWWRAARKRVAARIGRME